MKKISFLILFLLGFFFVFVYSSYLEDKVYCQFEDNSIGVFLFEKNMYKCEDYLRVIDNKINMFYKDLFYINQYINQGDEKDYWDNIKNNLLEKIDLIQNIRSKIKFSIVEFENVLFDKFKSFIKKDILSYKLKIQTKVIKIKKYEDLLTGEDSKIYMDYIGELSQDLVIIENLNKSEKFDELIKYLSDYFYLKNKYGGK